MEENILKIFARSTARYFETICEESAALGTPYLHAAEEVALDYSAFIGISGSYRGSIYYTAPREKLEALLPRLGESTATDQLCADLVGEITNTISGNAREELGAGFMISPPFVIQGRPTQVSGGKDAPCYVIPVNWETHRSRLLVTLTKTETTEREGGGQ